MTFSSPTLARVAKGDLCSGCGLCAAAGGGKVHMAVSRDGFLRPCQTAPLDAAQEDRVAAACPGARLRQPTPAGTTDHPMWGPLLQVRSGHAADPEIRRNASSGGALSALLVHLLECAEVDYVLQTTADTALPYGNRTVASLSRDAVQAAAGSRYAPSAPLAEIDAHLDGQGRFAFVGKPCDVAALRALARIDPRVDAKVPYMLSFFCAGVPSLDGAREVLQALDVDEAELAAFRYRGDGWPGYATARRHDGSTARMSYADSWGGILSRHVQFRCKICPDGTGGAADVVCADAWHCDDKGYPLFEEDDGWSLIVSRTGRGEELVLRAQEAGALTARPTPVDAVAQMQPGQVKRKSLALSRILGAAAMLRPAPRFDGFHLARVACGAGLRANLHSFLGTVRRIVRPKRRPAAAAPRPAVQPVRSSKLEAAE